MGHTNALTTKEKEYIYTQKIAGNTLTTIAQELGCSYECARKWWRVGRDGGFDALRAKRKSRGKTGALSQFPNIVQDTALALKKTHPKWGAAHVRLALLKDDGLTGRKIPSESRLAVFFKTYCPEHVATRKSKPSPKPAKATHPHHIWQMDAQEAIYLGNGEVASIFSIRDPFSSLVIATDAFSVKTKKRWRKLTIQEVCDVVRQGFKQWGTFPEIIQTDNEVRLGGHPNDMFPSILTLWLVGLGIDHQFSRPGKPTDQAQIERQHRTLNGFTYSEKDRESTVALQTALERESFIYNNLFPVRAGLCKGQPPLVAFPQLAQPKFAYSIDIEPSLFSLDRVFQYLARKTYTRKVTKKGQVRIGRKRYAIGRKHAGKSVLVRIDPNTREWCFLEEDDESEIVRLEAHGLDFKTLTGLDDQLINEPNHPIQLPLLFPV